MRVVKEGARQGHHVRLAFGDDGLGLLCGRDQSARCNPGCSASGSQPSHRHRIVRRETAVRPVATGNAGTERDAARHHGANRAHYIERKTPEETSM
jgi:hypothetical protein